MSKCLNVCIINPCFLLLPMPWSLSLSHSLPYLPSRLLNHFNFLLKLSGALLMLQPDYKWRQVAHGNVRWDSITQRVLVLIWSDSSFHYRLLPSPPSLARSGLSKAYAAMQEDSAVGLCAASGRCACCMAHGIPCALQLWVPTCLQHLLGLVVVSTPLM